MNRLIIIGNGFDLAHGLHTRYSDFLKWYWSRLNLITRNLYGRYSYRDNILELDLHNPILNCDSYYSLLDILKFFEYYKNGENYIFLNDFFIELNDNSLVNWVDIEMFYKTKLENAFHSNERINEIEKLNREFSDVRELFEQYLLEKIHPQEKEGMQIPIMCSILQGWVQGRSFDSEFIYDIPKHLTEDENFQKRLSDNKFTEKDGCTYILNFNYTNTVRRYISSNSETQVNYIHGFYQNKNHPIIFGYGDESDELFPLLEKANNNDYLRFTKSVSYLKKQNYTNLMNFVESNNFIVEVMGHSLAISDRTLLKTIFENDNCQYIFMYYHKREDGTTDFFDKSVNISRHFSDKKMMRKKVAPEVFCRPLPQYK